MRGGATQHGGAAACLWAWCFGLRRNASCGSLGDRLLAAFDRLHGFSLAMPERSGQAGQMVRPCSAWAREQCLGRRLASSVAGACGKLRSHGPNRRSLSAGQQAPRGIGPSAHDARGQRGLRRGHTPPGPRLALIFCSRFTICGPAGKAQRFAFVAKASPGGAPLKVGRSNRAPAHALR